jgi:hypothetical protein
MAIDSSSFFCPCHVFRLAVPRFRPIPADPSKEFVKSVCWAVVAGSIKLAPQRAQLGATTHFTCPAAPGTGSGREQWRQPQPAHSRQGAGDAGFSAIRKRWYIALRSKSG